ncbi:unnamed protein product [Diamesa serratosioi]
MEAIETKFKSLFTIYKKWISKNPDTCADVEVFMKYFTYFMAGKVTDDSDSSVLTESVLSLSNLLVLFNDQIIKKEYYKSQGVHKSLHNVSEDKLKLCLTILEHVEVLIEISSKRVLGDKRKFIIIFFIQAIKCITRLVLILKFKNKIVTVPATASIDRKNIETIEKPSSSIPDIDFSPDYNDGSSITFTLKRSGKVIRRVSKSPPIYNRNLVALEASPSSSSASSPNRSFISNASSTSKAITNAEIIYILKPMIHLSSVGIFGYKSWKSWMCSLALDMYSLRTYYNNRQYLSTAQKKELSRRCVTMILYIMRSPFYESVSHNKIDAFLRALSSIPFAKQIFEPLRQYIPHYQGTYFYMWS